MAWYNPFSWGGGPDEVNYGNINRMNQQFIDMGQKQAGEMRGISSGITAQDKEMYGQSYGMMRDLVMGDLRNQLPGLLAGVSGQAGARGMSGSGMEQGMRQQAGIAGQQQAGQVLQQFGAQQAGLMQQGAATRFGQEMSRNQALWHNLMQSYMPQYQTEQGRISSEEQRIAQEKGAFGNMLGGIAGFAAGGFSHLIPGFKQQPQAQPQQQQQQYRPYESYGGYRA